MVFTVVSLAVCNILVIFHNKKSRGVSVFLSSAAPPPPKHRPLETNIEITIVMMPVT